MSLRDDLQAALGSTRTIERELGGGGMSRLFVGEETAFGRKVAVKVLAPELAAGVSAERFQLHGAHGNADSAVYWLNRAVDKRNGTLFFTSMPCHPSLAALKDDPGFHAVLRRMGVERCQLKPTGRLNR